LDNHKKKLYNSLSWEKLFKEFFLTLYFQNHLLKHYYRPHLIIICLNKSINLEVLNLLNILTQKYSFFKLRLSELQNLNADLEQNYLLTSNLSTDKILKSNTCLLIGVNPRYEGSKLNLILRSRHLKGNFKVIQIGSLISLTFPNINITSNIKILKSLVEGNNLFCQEFVNSLSPILISNSEIFQRKDSLSITSILKFLIKHVNLFSQFNCQKSQNILNLALNDVGFLNFKNLKTIKKKDFENSAGIFFINNAFLTSNIKKLLNLKLLNFFQNYTRTNRLLITQNNNLNVKIVTQLKKNFNLTNHLHLPNTVLLETAGTYINTEGNINKTTKIITSLGQTKSD